MLPLCHSKNSMRYKLCFASQLWECSCMTCYKCLRNHRRNEGQQFLRCLALRLALLHGVMIVITIMCINSSNHYRGCRHLKACFAPSTLSRAFSMLLQGARIEHLQAACSIMAVRQVLKDQKQNYAVRGSAVTQCS